MFLIHEKEEAYQSPECFKCLEDYDAYSGYCGYQDMCEDCKETVKTIFECPQCSTTHTFYGESDPVYCESCKVLLPDILNLKDSPTKRLGYHNRVEGDF